MNRVNLKVNTITSVKDEYPIEYYHLPFYQPLEGIKVEHENLGEFLSDDRWFSITNSVIIVLVLTILVAGVLVKNVRSDYDRYSKVFDEESDEDGLGDSGWKLVHAYVLRERVGCGSSRSV